MSVPVDERLAALEDQRDFLLRSLEDLEREHDAGDVDDHDYEALKDDYTARAAAVLRAIDAGRPRGPRRSSRRGTGRAVLVAAAVVAFAGLAGVLVAQSAGRRDEGEVATGGTRQSVTEKLNEAGRRGAESDFDGAVAVYDEVLEIDPGNAEALTYKGWMLTLSDEQEDGLQVLLEAATANPTYPDVHAFLAVVFFRNGLVEQAARELDRLDALDPPPAIRQLTDPLRTQVDRAAASAASPTTTAP
ncbi:MAG: tetratricopeptide repeat protein [Acidimicrobiales bacterium]